MFITSFFLDGAEYAVFAPRGTVRAVRAAARRFAGEFADMRAMSRAILAAGGEIRPA